MNNIKQQTKQAVCELIETAKLKPGQILVVGCSSSEIAGQKIGTGSTVDIAREVFEVIFASFVTKICTLFV